MITAPQNTEAGRLLRQMSRAAWRDLWRAERIVRRETAKAFYDAMIFGVGYSRWGKLGAWERDGSDVLRSIPHSEYTVPIFPEPNKSKKA